jgi:hypothetical protein
MPVEFQIIELPDKPTGYVHISTSNDWESWIKSSLPTGLHNDIEKRLISNLKHILASLELKAALIVPHARFKNNPSLLFEPYFQGMIFEFCVGVFSLCEGLGSAHYLREKNLDGSTSPRIKPGEWMPALVRKFDAANQRGLNADVEHVQKVRDKLHQDHLGARTEIDWHAFSYDGAFVTAARAVKTLLKTNADKLPAATNLKGQ